MSWKPEYHMDLKTIDSQHDKMFQLIERLNQAVLNNQGGNIITEILRDLRKYTKVHFTYEERHFIKYEWENTKEHKDLHISFINQIDDFFDSYIDHKKQRKLNEFSKDVITYMVNWFLNHILVEDKKYLRLFKEKGIS